MAKRLARTGYESMNEWDGSAWMSGWGGGGCATWVDVWMSMRGWVVVGCGLHECMGAWWVDGMGVCVWARSIYLLSLLCLLCLLCVACIALLYSLFGVHTGNHCLGR